MLRQPVDLPPIISVEFIQISDKTNIPFAPKARKVIEKVKEEEKRVVSEQAPPAAKAKEKPDRIPLPKEQEKKKEIVKKKQNPEEVKPEIRQASEFEKKEIELGLSDGINAEILSGVTMEDKIKVWNETEPEKKSGVSIEVH